MERGRVLQTDPSTFIIEWVITVKNALEDLREKVSNSLSKLSQQVFSQNIMIPDRHGILTEALRRGSPFVIK